MTYMEIAEKLRQEIFLGRIASGAKLSARRIAERYGVSYLTGNRALNLLNEQNLIIRKPRGGSYVNEAGSRSRLIGFSIEHYRQNVFNQTAGVFREILLSEFRKRNFKVRMLSPNDWSPEWLGDLDALLFSHELDRKQEKSAASLGIPVLQFYGERIWNHPFHQAVIDLESGFRELFRHVTPERFRKAFIVTADDATMSLRARLAEQLLREQGFPSGRVEIVLADNILPERNWPLWKELGPRCAGNFLFSCGDYLAAGLISALTSEGIVVGRDVSLAGYDNLEEYGFLPFGTPLITAVGYSRRDAAVAIARQFQTLLCEPDAMKCQTILKIPTHAVFRKTMGPSGMS